MTDLISVDQMNEVLPKNMKGKISQEMLDHMTQTINDPTALGFIRDNMLGFANVLSEGKFRVDRYIDAVKFCSFRMMGHNNIDAYKRAFPERYQRHVTNGKTAKDISAYVSAFASNKLVVIIMEQTMIPIYIMNQDKLQQAINVQAELMVHATSEKVRSDAANSLLTHLKQPETKKMELDIAVKEDKSIAELRQVTLELVKKQKEMITNKELTANDVAKGRLFEGEIEDV